MDDLERLELNDGYVSYACTHIVNEVVSSMEHDKVVYLGVGVCTGSRIPYRKPKGGSLTVQ